MKKVILATLVIFSAFFLILCSSAFADKSGTLSTGVSWSLTTGGVLTITGNGEIPDCSLEPAPWQDEKVVTLFIKNGITKINFCAFSGLEMLTYASIADSVTEIYPWAFTGCTRLKTVILPKNLTTIEGDVFGGCTKLENITIPDKVTSIEWAAFDACESLKTINIPKSVQTIRYSAFRGCSSLTSVVLPDGLTKLEAHTFYGCKNLKSVNIPDTVEIIEDDVFCFCSSLTEVTLPKNLKKIGEYAFGLCSQLRKIEIHDEVYLIKRAAFNCCYELKDVYYSGTKKEWKNIEIEIENDCLVNAVLHPIQANIVLPASLKKIQDEAFYNCKNLVIYIPRNVRSISSSAFDPSVTILCDSGSYAEARCKQLGLKVKVQ